MAATNDNKGVFARRALIAAVVTAAVLVTALLVREVLQILLVFFAGVLFAIMLAGLSELLQRVTRLPYGLALLTVCLVIVVVIAATVWFVGPQVGQQLTELGQRLPEAVEQAARRLRQYDWLGGLLDELPSPDEALDKNVLARVTSLFSTAFGALFNTIVVVFVGLYMAAKPQAYSAVVLRLVPPARRERVEHMLQTMGTAMKRWLVGRFLTMLFIGVGTTLALWLVGMPLAFSLGLVAGLLSFIPYLGPVLSAVPAVLIALADGPQMMLYVVLIYVAIQTVESYLISPLVERRSVYIPPGFQIPVQLMAGVLAGFMGVLVATPLIVIATIAVQMLYVEDVLGDHPRIVGED